MLGVPSESARPRRGRGRGRRAQQVIRGLGPRAARDGAEVPFTTCAPTRAVDVPALRERRTCARAVHMPVASARDRARGRGRGRVAEVEGGFCVCCVRGGGEGEGGAEKRKKGTPNSPTPRHALIPLDVQNGARVRGARDLGLARGAGGARRARARVVRPRAGGRRREAPDARGAGAAGEPLARPGEEREWRGARGRRGLGAPRHYNNSW
ncbi:hypothetical protein B0H11DRAFT_1954814 [Mycena galericulata]|nr:hypothetical protein B0H11DRAFT_1954814 [Mycena galericulata]